MNIIESIFKGTIYPKYDKPILDYFSGFYESVFIAFHPFFVLTDESKQNKSYNSFSGSIKLSKEEYEDSELSKLIEYNSNKEIYNSNDNYPSDDLILNSSRIVSWNNLKSLCDFQNYSQMQIALLTNIGALKKKYQKQELSKKLNEYCMKHHIWQPIEGRFPPIVKREIITYFQSKGYNEIILQDEFGDKTEKLNIKNINFSDFIEHSFTDIFRSVYSNDKKILFTVDWDSFFFLICSTKENIESFISNSIIEGFYCKSNTGQNWYFSNEV